MHYRFGLIIVCSLLLFSSLTACRHGGFRGGFDEFDMEAWANRIASRLDLSDVQKEQLIDNALKNTYEDGSPVRVHVAREESSVDIIVEDWGVGIPKSALQSLFDPFYRPDTSLPARRVRPVATG
jgi:hypothetical protein